jgi:hypothetical protein
MLGLKCCWDSDVGAVAWFLSIIFAESQIMVFSRCPSIHTSRDFYTYSDRSGQKLTPNAAINHKFYEEEENIPAVHIGATVKKDKVLDANQRYVSAAF